jgi:hypothetical protein
MFSGQSAKRAREVAGPRFNRRVSAFIRVGHEQRHALTLFPTSYRAARAE